MDHSHNPMPAATGDPAGHAKELALNIAETFGEDAISAPVAAALKALLPGATFLR